MRLSIAVGCALLTALALPPRLWKPQLRRLGLLALLLFVFTAIGSGAYPPSLHIVDISCSVHTTGLMLCRWGPASNAAEASPNSPRGSARDASPSTELSICYFEPLVHHYHSSLNQPWDCSSVPYLCSLSGKLSHVHLRSTAYTSMHLPLCTFMYQNFTQNPAVLDEPAVDT